MLDKFISERWPYGATSAGQVRLARYDECYADWKNSADEPDPPSDDGPGKGASQFAFEADLRDYLAKNLGLLESGMTLWPTPNGESAVEFHLDGGRRIDVLARDSKDIPVVIELKVKKGHEYVIGQALYYRACIHEKFSVSEVRTIIVAGEIGPELHLAIKELANVQLFEYQLSMTLTKV